MKKYNQLTSTQRYEIGLMLAEGLTGSSIAENLGVNASTISRELNRNCDKRSSKYSPILAQSKTESRHQQKSKHIRFTPAIQGQVVELLREDYSPEQVKGYLKSQGEDYVSPESIYKYVWQDKKQKGSLYKHLRSKGRRYRKRGALKDSRGRIINRIDIDKRPKVVELKHRLGDLEVDTIIGKNHKGAIVTINCRATGMLKMKRVDTKESRPVADAIIEELQEWKPFIKTITADNGKEFAEHQRIAEELGIDFYFAKPYHSWERGANENLNGLVRQYFPKGSDFSNIDHDYLKKIEEKLNRRPRKRYKFDSPQQVMAHKINQTSILHL
jgi:IS30 family transposase